MTRQEYTLVFELGEYDVTRDELGMLLEDLLNKRFPGIYMDVMWKVTP